MAYFFISNSLIRYVANFTITISNTSQVVSNRKALICGSEDAPTTDLTRAGYRTHKKITVDVKY